MGITIERITQENLSDFLDMVEFRLKGLWPEQPTPASENALWALSQPNFWMYGARLDGERMQGWIAMAFAPKVGKFKRGHVYINELWVSPAHRRHGIAKELMARADEIAEELKADGLRLYVDGDNTGARRLYQQCGFTMDGPADYMQKICIDV